MEGAPEATGAEEREWEEYGKEGGTQTLSEGLSDICTSQLVQNAGGMPEGWRESWLGREMERLEERGEEVPDTDGGELNYTGGEEGRPIEVKGGGSGMRWDGSSLKWRRRNRGRLGVQ